MFLVLSLEINTEEETKNEIMALTVVTSDEPVSEVSNLKCTQGNLTSNYHNITFLRVPIAEAESDFETLETEDEEQDEEDQVDEEDETNENHSYVMFNLFSWGRGLGSEQSLTGSAGTY